MVTLIIVGVLAWALKEATEDVIRTAKGDPPPHPRKGFRGYVEDRWNALADRHHRAEESGLITQLDAWAYKRHLARKKALKRAGFKTEEDIARAAVEHRRRMALIEQGINPDTMPPLFSKLGKVQEPTTPPVILEDPAEPEEAAEPEALKPEPGVSIDGHYYDNVEVWLNPEYFPPEQYHDPQPGIDDYYPPEPDENPDTQAEPWSPYAPTETKENSMSNNGEITGPAGVKQFHDDLKASMDGAASIVDILVGLAYELEGRANDTAANLTATDTAAGGMDALGMTDAAAAARSLMEIQEAIRAALNDAAAIKDHAARISDQVGASQAHLATIKTAYDAQTRMKDERVGAGLGNLARDQYLDEND
jgi:hypothetical protein